MKGYTRASKQHRAAQPGMLRTYARDCATAGTSGAASILLLLASLLSRARGASEFALGANAEVDAVGSHGATAPLKLCLTCIWRTQHAAEWVHAAGTRRGTGSIAWPENRP